MRKATLIVEGTVQGVGLRYRVQNEAQSRKINGYAKNLIDGTVEIVCEGKKKDLEGLVDAIRNFREPIIVKNIRAEYSKGRGEFKTFTTEREGLEKSEGDTSFGMEALSRKMDIMIDELKKGFHTGAVYLEAMLGKQDQMLDKQDQMLDKQDETIAEIRKIGEKQDETISEIRKIGEKQDQMLDKQDQMLGKQDQMLDKQDQMLGKQDQMLGKQDQMLGKQDQMLGKQDETVGEIRKMNSNISDAVDAGFRKLEGYAAKSKSRIDA